LIAAGQLEQAVQVLGKMIETKPDDPQLQEKMGDVYLKLAIRRYGKVLRNNAVNQLARVKLANVNQLLTELTTTGVGEVQAERSQDHGVHEAEVQRTVAVLQKSAPLNAREASERDLVVRAFGHWEVALKEQDVPSYLSYHADDTNLIEELGATSAGGGKRGNEHGAWQVFSESPTVEVLSSKATVRLSKNYESVSKKEQIERIISLNKELGEWKVVDYRKRATLAERRSGNWQVIKQFEIR